MPDERLGEDSFDITCAAQEFVLEQIFIGKENCTMIPVFYRTYPYSMSATIISVIGTVISVFSVAMGFSLLSESELIPFIICIAIAVGSYFILSCKVAGAISKATSEQNIRTKVKYAKKFCKAHPKEYNKIALLNPAFGEQYMIDESGKLIKRK